MGVGGLINFPPQKRGGGAYLRGGLIQDLRYIELAKLGLSFQKLSSQMFFF